MSFHLLHTLLQRPIVLTGRQVMKCRNIFVSYRAAGGSPDTTSTSIFWTSEDWLATFWAESVDMLLLIYISIWFVGGMIVDALSTIASTTRQNLTNNLYIVLSDKCTISSIIHFVIALPYFSFEKIRFLHFFTLFLGNYNRGQAQGTERTHLAPLLADYPNSTLTSLPTKQHEPYDLSSHVALEGGWGRTIHHDLKPSNRKHLRNSL